MKLRFGNNPPISFDASLPLAQVREPVQITLTARTQGLFAVIVRDPDAQARSGSEGAVGGMYYHEVTINADSNLNGDTVIPYSPPEMISHRYVYEVYEQPFAFDISGDIGRQSFDLDAVKKETRMQLVAAIIITTTEIDRRSITERSNAASLTSSRSAATRASEAPASRREAVLKAASEHGFVLPGLSERDTKYCRCVAHVAAKDGKYNPYAVCARSTGGSVRSCSPYYDFESMPLPELLGYARQKGITIPDRSSRESAVRAILDWKAREGK